MIALGFVPLLLSLIICGIVGVFGWKLILALYPQYFEIQQGFTYNGHWYITFFVFLSLAITFAIYKKFTNKFNEPSYYVAPLLFWLLINVAVFIFLQGAAFFIIPVFFALLSFFVMLRQERPNLLAMADRGSSENGIFDTKRAILYSTEIIITIFSLLLSML